MCWEALGRWFESSAVAFFIFAVLFILLFSVEVKTIFTLCTLWTSGRFLHY